MAATANGAMNAWLKAGSMHRAVELVALADGAGIVAGRLADPFGHAPHRCGRARHRRSTRASTPRRQGVRQAFQAKSPSVARFEELGRRRLRPIGCVGDEIRQQSGRRRVVRLHLQSRGRDARRWSAANHWARPWRTRGSDRPSNPRSASLWRSRHPAPPNRRAR